jgi:hypothetical protein
MKTLGNLGLATVLTGIGDSSLRIAPFRLNHAIKISQNIIYISLTLLIIV